MEDKKQFKILLCEDDANLGMVLKNYLELNDYEITLERDGRLGLAAFQREKFDICFAFSQAFSLKLLPLSTTSGILGKSFKPNTFILDAYLPSNLSSSAILPIFLDARTNWRILRNYFDSAAI